MAKVLVVHQTVWSGVESNYRQTLKSHDVVVVRYPLAKDLDALSPDSELCCVGLRPKQAGEVQRRLGLNTEPRRLPDLRGAHASELRSWISGARTTNVETEKPAEPTQQWPGYKEYILSEVAKCPRLILSQSALNRAGRVVGREDMYGHHFIEFIRDAVDALIFIADSPHPVDLQVALASRNSLEYAPTGGDFTAWYENPATGGLTSTKRHLKPATERRGFYSSDQKPRLYFDTFTDPKTRNPWVILLYFGPHPNENTNNQFVLPPLPTFVIGRSVNR